MGDSLSGARDRLVQAAAGPVSRQGARDWLLAATDQGLISLSNFLAGVYLARMLDPTQFGIYAVGFLLLHGVGAVQEGIILQPLSTLGAMMGSERFGRYLTAAGVIQIGQAAVSALAAAGVGWLLTALGNDMAGPTLFGLWFVFLVWQPQEFLRRLFYPARRIRDAVVNTAAASLVRLAVLVWFGSRGELSGMAGMDAIAWGALAAIPVGVWQARKYWRRTAIDMSGTWRENWAFGRWVLGGQLAGWVSLEVYPILAAGLVSFAAAGAYRAVQTLVAPVHVVIAALDPFLTPRAARAEARVGRAALRRVLRRAFLFLGIPVFAYLLVVAIAAPLALNLLFGDKYLVYSPAVALFCVQYALWFVYFPYQVGLKAMQRTRPIFVAHGLAIVAMFTVGVVLIQLLGVYGAVLGQVLNALIALVVITLAWKRASETPGPVSLAVPPEGQTGEHVPGP
ncbi:MAG: lipopolysaccharide biosynthesis protein [Anaerolineales bacterium]|nr:lipopolysaccharide biosynthesis protein [Anaerolineales bacterium]